MLIKKFRDAKPGDLLFFDEKEEIVHVGILIEPGVMIHSSGKVRLDAVDKKGLVNPEIKSRKLRLRMIRRVFSVDSQRSTVLSQQSSVNSLQSTIKTTAN
jgi:cell wall-associated NlpC family hydrolase